MAMAASATPTGAGLVGDAVAERLGLGGGVVMVTVVVRVVVHVGFAGHQRVLLRCQVSSGVLNDMYNDISLLRIPQVPPRLGQPVISSPNRTTVSRNSSTCVVVVRALMKQGRST